MLRTILIKHGQLGLIGRIAGIASGFAAIAVINRQEEATRLALDPLAAVVITGVAVALSPASAALVTWQPTHVRPLVVLRED